MNQKPTKDVEEIQKDEGSGLDVFYFQQLVHC